MNYWATRPILEKLPAFEDFFECRVSLEEFIQKNTHSHKHLAFRIIKSCNESARIYCANYNWSAKYGNRIWLNTLYFYIQLPVSWIPKCLCCNNYPVGGMSQLTQAKYKSKELIKYTCLYDSDYVCLNCHSELVKLDEQFLLIKENKTLINKLKQVTKNG